MKLLLTLLALLASPAFAEQVSEKYLNEVFERVSLEVEVPEKLIRAICFTESHYRSNAYNHGDGTGTNHAFGICQVLHSTAREHGFKDDKCFRDFRDVLDEQGNLVAIPRTYKECKLFGVYTNVFYAAKYLKAKLDQYDQSWVSAIAAYNGGSVRTCTTGRVLRAKDKKFLWKCTKGGILNQVYVDKVMKALEDPK